MAFLSRARTAAAWSLDLLALAAIARVVPFLAGPHGPLIPTGVVAQALAAAPGLLLLRTLIESRPPFWARAIFGEATTGARVVAGAAAGTIGAALGAVAGWSFVHPHTDYPAAAALGLGALGAAVPVTVLVSVVAFLWRRVDSRPGVPVRGAYLLGTAVVALLVWAWNPAADRVFSSAHSLVGGLVVGAGVLVVVGAALLAGTAAPGMARRVGAGLGLAAVLVPGFGWIQRPLAGDPEPPEGWPHAVVLVTIDTLRADHMGAHGYSRDTSPRLDALAARSVLFENAYAAMPTTDPSHAAILTGRLPRTTGITRNGQAVARDDVVSLASWLRSHGYRTGAVTSRAHLDPVSLRIPGFQTFSAPVHTADGSETHRRASTWIARHGDRPFFLWVHFWDPHSPYEPPAEQAARFVEGSPAEFVHGIHPLLERPERHAPGAIRYAKALYDAEIRDVDTWVGRLADESDERFGAGRVLTIVTSDHGETLDEHDAEYRYAFDHGKILSRHELHVPLIVSWPGRLPGGVRVARTVSNAALLPTLGSVLGDPVEADLEGFADLLTGQASTAPDDLPLLVERRSFVGPVPVPFLGAPEVGIVDDGWLYVENPERGAFLTALGDGPTHREGHPAADPDRAGAMALTLRDLAARYPPAAATLEEMDPEKIEALRSLGYIQ